MAGTYTQDEENVDAPPGKRTLDELLKLVEDFRSLTEQNRNSVLLDYDYYDGNQISSTDKAALLLRGQPDVVVNRTRVAVNGILGVVIKSHTDPKAWPRTEGDDDSASVATDCLRYVSQSTKFNRSVKGPCFKDYLVGGTTAVLIGVGDQKKVKTSQVRWEELIYDPRARRIDLLDSKYMGIGKWMYVDDVQGIYQGKRLDLQYGGGGLGGIFGMSESMADRPVDQGWIDRRNGRILTIEMYCRYGKVWWKHVFYYGGILEEGPSPYVNDDGTPINPILAVSCYVDRNNNRMGVVRDMRPLQDEINKRRSKLLHLANSSQIQAKDPSAIEVNADAARLEAARPDGVIPYGWEKVKTTDIAAGQAALLTEAKSEMERLGPNPAVLGRQGADSSGRALLTRQQAGLIEMAVFLDQMEDWELRIYEAWWQRIKQFWDEPQIIRVTDDEDAPRSVKINQPIPGQVPVMHPETQQPMVDPNTGQPMMMDGVLGYKNSVAEMDVDLTIDITPQTATIQQEQLEDLMKLIGTSPTYAAQVPFEVVLDLMPIPRKRQLIQKIKSFREAAEAASQEQQQKQMEIAVHTALAKVGHVESQTLLNQAKANKLGADATAVAIGTSNETAKTLHEVSQPDEPKQTGA